MSEERESKLGEYSAMCRAINGLIGLFKPNIYHLEHKELGAMDRFLVPVGPEAHEMRYEAVFG